VAHERGMPRFTWRRAKAEANRKKHGVSFEEALTVFADVLARIIDDPDHSSPGDERAIILGSSTRGRLLVVVFTEPDEDTLHLISARPATRREKRNHEEAQESR
jgi:uncharacterized protein